MAKKQRGRKISWRAYSREYNARRKELEKRGYVMHERKLTAAEFRYRYKAMKLEREEEIANGERKTIGNITRDLIKDQEYKYSAKQGKAIQKAYENFTGNRISISSIRHGGNLNDFWNTIDMFKEELAQQGVLPDEIAIQVSQGFFGSP